MLLTTHPKYRYRNSQKNQRDGRKSVQSTVLLSLILHVMLGHGIDILYYYFVYPNIAGNLS